MFLLLAAPLVWSGLVSCVHCFAGSRVLIVIGHLADDVLIQPFIIRQMDFEVNETAERHWRTSAKTNKKCLTEITKKC